jgi:hypothetical protein
MPKQVRLRVPENQQVGDGSLRSEKGAAPCVRRLIFTVFTRDSGARDGKQVAMLPLPRWLACLQLRTGRTEKRSCSSSSATPPCKAATLFQLVIPGTRWQCLFLAPCPLADGPRPGNILCTQFRTTSHWVCTDALFNEGTDMDVWDTCGLVQISFDRAGSSWGSRAATKFFFVEFGTSSCRLWKLRRILGLFSTRSRQATHSVPFVTATNGGGCGGSW